MAIDTRSKRASAVGLLLGFTVLVPILPDGTIATADRPHSAWSYTGITIAIPAVPTPRELELSASRSNTPALSASRSNTVALSASET